MAVRLFIGNLPYGASEADLRAHFAAVAEPSHVVMPVDRETGRPRGFAFVEFIDREQAEEVIKRFDAQPFQGRNLAVSEARAREDRPPGGFAPRPGGFGGPRPGGGGGFGGPRPAAVAASAARGPVAAADSAVRGPAAPRWAPAAATAAQTSALPRRPSGCAARRAARTRSTSRAGRSRNAAAAASMRSMISDDDSSVEIDDIATAAKDDVEVDVEAPDAPDATEAPDAPDDDNET